MSAGDASRLQLEAIAGKATGFLLAVDERIVFGRQNEGPGRLADDPELSRHHAQIERDESGQYVVEDLSSTNGTYVNGERISAPCPLAVGDEIELGGTTLAVRSAPAPALPDVDVRAPTMAAIDVPAEMQPEPEPVTDARLTLSIAIDLDSGEARITPAGGDPLVARLEDGRWTAAASA
jgi:hypothetical protein